MGQEEEGKVPGSDLRNITGFLLHPARAFRDTREASFRDGLRYYAIFLIAAIALTALVVVNHAVSMAQKYPLGYHAPVLPYVSVIVAASLLAGTAGFGIVALLLHLLVVACGGRKGVVRTVNALLYAATPLLLLGWLLVALALYNSPAYIPVLIAVILWAVALAVLGLREFHGLSTARAVMPFLLAVVLILIGLLVILALAEGDPCGGMCSHVTAATAACSGDNILVTYQGGVDASSLVNLTVRINGEVRSPQIGGMEGVLPVGSSAVYTGPFPGRNNVVATAYYSDGLQQVILDTYLGCGSGPPATTRLTDVPAAPAVPAPAATAAPPPANSKPLSPISSGKGTAVVQPAGTATARDDTTCGGVRFDPAVHGCCGGRQFLLDQSVCCGGALYDNATTGCCGSRPYNYTTQDCCGTTIYDQKTEYCCNNEIATFNCDWGIADINVTGIHMVQDAGGTPAIAGTIVNNGTVTYTSVHMAVACYDANGTRIDGFLVGSPPGREGILKGGSMVRFGDVKDGGTMDFLIPARNPATKTMRILSLEAFYSRGSTLLTIGTG